MGYANFENDTVVVFRGHHFSVHLQPRLTTGETDRHVRVIVSTGKTCPKIIQGSFSSYWNMEVIQLLVAAEAWMKENCDPDMGVEEMTGAPKQWGWVLRKGQEKLEFNIKL